MKKWLIILIIAMIVILGGFGIYKYVGARSIKKANIIMYQFLECRSECGLTQIRNLTTFNEECMECSGDFSGLSQDMQTIGRDSNNPTLRNEKYGDKIIIGSEEHISCLSENGAEDYQSCIKEILPILKEKYKIV